MSVNTNTYRSYSGDMHQDFVPGSKNIKLEHDPSFCDYVDHYVRADWVKGLSTIHEPSIFIDELLRVGANYWDIRDTFVQYGMYVDTFVSQSLASDEAWAHLITRWKEDTERIRVVVNDRELEKLAWI